VLCAHSVEFRKKVSWNKILVNYDIPCVSCSLMSSVLSQGDKSVISLNSGLPEDYLLSGSHRWASASVDRIRKGIILGLMIYAHGDIRDGRRRIGVRHLIKNCWKSSNFTTETFNIQHNILSPPPPPPPGLYNGHSFLRDWKLLIRAPLLMMMMMGKSPVPVRSFSLFNQLQNHY